MIYAKKINNAFHPTFDQTLFEQIPNNTEVELRVSQPRNYEFHKKFYKLLHIVFENQDRFTNLEALRIWLKIKTGWCDIYLLDGHEVRVPKSIAFDKMDNTQFKDFYDRCLDEIVSKLNFEKETLIEEIETFM